MGDGELLPEFKVSADSSVNSQHVCFVPRFLLQVILRSQTPDSFVATSLLT